MEEDAMSGTSMLRSAAIAVGAAGALLTTVLHAQELGGPGAPWRGAGPQPCFGADGGTYQCRPTAGVVAVRAGRLFDSRRGELLSDQVVLIEGERITEVGAGGEGARLRSNLRALHRAVHGRQRQQGDRRQVPDDPDLREGGGDGGLRPRGSR